MAKNKQKAELSARATDLLYQALETELGGVEIYGMALKCVRNEELREEWTEYLEQTENHVQVMRKLCEALGLDPELDTPGRQVVRHIGKSLVRAMEMALGSAPPESAELVATECVVLAETKDHTNWHLIGKLAEESDGATRDALEEAFDEVEDEEDEHLYHTTGWSRELWLHSLGLPAELPPPEEVEDVQTAEEALEAKEMSEAARER